MITLEECREILGGDSALTDSQLEELRDQLYRLAEIVVALTLEAHGYDLGSAIAHRTKEG
jgi:hypothetical protein